MYYNVYGEKVSRRRYKEAQEAAKNRRELIAAGLTSRRDLFKMGLLTAGGMLVAKSGLSARAQVAAQTLSGGSGTKTNNPPSSKQTESPGTNQNCVVSNQMASPATTPFVSPCPIMPTAAHTALSKFNPQPTNQPNPNSGTDGKEARAFAHQGPTNYPALFPNANLLGNNYYKFHQVSFNTNQFSPQLPTQTIWGFNDGTNGPQSPGPTYVARYGTPQL